ncbi:hypothetical protein [Kribbella sp. NPDC051137]|uniref:hypothetical protein n=1 Tax=Kribbella sp. NPDC051137 TaxID=3155045 RepID=UPI003442883D
MRRLHEAVAGHRHYKAFREQFDEIDAAEARAKAREARVLAELRDQQAALDEYNRHCDEAALAGEEPTLSYPGPVETPESRGVRNSTALFHERRIDMEERFRQWLGRNADEFRPRVAAEQSRLDAEAAELVARLRAVASEMDLLRDTLDLVNACTGAARVVGPRPSAEAIVAGGRGLATGLLPLGAAVLPMNLDGVDIE